mgnify:CR=1 FL=1
MAKRAAERGNRHSVPAGTAPTNGLALVEPVAPAAVKLLSLAELTAITSTQQEIGRLQNKMTALLTEAGLDPRQNWQITPDGVVTPGGQR